MKSQIEGRKSYFRHDATDVKNNKRKCTFSNQDYRHDQAILFLERLKKIKVPILYKYPPVKKLGPIIKIKESQFIEAYFTKKEITFYETENGEVKFGSNPDIEDRYLLIKPDVVFFNNKKEPILLIEVVATHKVDDEKKAKIRRVGIDTVQVSIPKASIEDIKNIFSETVYTKWIYNYEQENTPYIQSSNAGSEGIPQVDEIQRHLFEESFECRQSQIRNLVRTI